VSYITTAKRGRARYESDVPIVLQTVMQLSLRKQMQR
jgi:hypothetical protein